MWAASALGCWDGLFLRAPNTCYHQVVTIGDAFPRLGTALHRKVPLCPRPKPWLLAKPRSPNGLAKFSSCASAWLSAKRPLAPVCITPPWPSPDGRAERKNLPRNATSNLEILLASPIVGCFGHEPDSRARICPACFRRAASPSRAQSPRALMWSLPAAVNADKN